MIRVDEIWACNAAVRWLSDKGLPVTHAIGLDPSEGLGIDWAKTYPVTYYLASCIRPDLTQRILQDKRKVEFFHTEIGLPVPEDVTLPPGFGDYQHFLYTELFPLPNIRTDGGLNVLTRAASLALVSGFETVYLLGADCAFQPNDLPLPGEDDAHASAWLAQQVVYADGRNALDMYGPGANVIEATIDGRRWVTRDDMAVSALSLTLMKWHWGARIQLVGDILPKVLATKDHAFLSQLPQATERGIEGINLRLDDGVVVPGKDVSPRSIYVPGATNYETHIRENAKLATAMVQPQARYGKSVAICGFGPSLAATAGDLILGA